MNDRLWKYIASNWQVIFLGLLVIGRLLMIDPDMIGGDTGAYITLHTFRPPIYPIFIHLFQVFGNYQFILVMWVQTILAFLSLLYARQWLIRRLQLSKNVTFIICLFTILQIFFHFHMMEMLYSEAISFALFILFFINYIECFMVPKIKSVIFLLVLMCLLILTRTQFYFLYSLWALMIFWIYWKKEPLQKLYIVTSLVVVCLLSTFVIERGYHRHFRAYQAGVGAGYYFLIHSLYLASPTDSQYFENLQEKEIFTKIITQLEKKQLTKDSMPQILGKPPTLRITNNYYLTVYIDLSHAITDLGVFSHMTYSEIEAISYKISKTLFFHSYKKNIVFYLWRTLSFFGDVSIAMIVLGTIFFAGLRIGKDRNWRPDVTTSFIIISFVIMISNLIFINIFEISETRYLYYVIFLIYCLAGLLSERLFTHSREPILSVKVND